MRYEATQYFRIMCLYYTKPILTITQLTQYAPLKRFDQVNDHFMDGKGVSPKLMVFCGVKANGIFVFSNL